jgi:TRAP-type mannitol/chloroaromatic compound transport system permease small subunit
VTVQKFLLAVDRLSVAVGRAGSWTIALLTALIVWEVFSRYLLSRPHAWVYDAELMVYGVLFMMAGAYTLAQSGHVRGDVLYSFFEPRTQAAVDLVLYFVFFLPGVFALTYAGWGFASDSAAIDETTFSPEPLPLYPIKFVIPLAGFFLFLQGIVEIIRCLRCLVDGAWPSRVPDVAEVDVDKLKEMVHVKDEDIAALDRYVVEQEKKS